MAVDYRRAAVDTGGLWLVNSGRRLITVGGLTLMVLTESGSGVSGVVEKEGFLYNGVS